MLMYLCRVSFLTTLDIYKAYFKGRYIREYMQKVTEYLIPFERSYYVFAP